MVAASFQGFLKPYKWDNTDIDIEAGLDTAVTLTKGVVDIEVKDEAVHALGGKSQTKSGN